MTITSLTFDTNLRRWFVGRMVDGCSTGRRGFDDFNQARNFWAGLI